jgi:hypothetical protein
MVTLVITACVGGGGVASVARADDLPPVPADNKADYVPVAKRPRSEVLAKGQQWLRPDLTRGTINDYRDLLGWILQIKFTDAQCDEFEQKIILLWPTLLSWDVEEITGGTKASADIRAMPPAQLRATHKDMNERVLKNLRKIAGGAMQLDNFTPVGELGKWEAKFLMPIYEDQHPEARPALPAVPGAAGPAQPQSTAQPKADAAGAAQTKPNAVGATQPKPAAPPAPPAGEAPRGAAAPAVDQVLANGSAAPLKKSSTDALSNVICFLSAKSKGGEYLPPTEAFTSMFARKVAAEYPNYTPEQQALFARLPEVWTGLRSGWDQLSASDQNKILAQWKPLIDSLNTATTAAAAAAPAKQQELSPEDRAALASMNEQQARTQAQLEQLRALRQRDVQQQVQMAQMERMQQMQAEQIRMMSNIAASAHDTNMTIIRNMAPTRHPWD